MAQHPDVLTEIMSSRTKVVQIACSMLSGEHERGRVPAAKMLHTIAASELYVRKVEVAIPAIVDVLRMPDVDWAAVIIAKTQAAMALKFLIENSDFEQMAVKEVRRGDAIKCGAIPPLVSMLISGRADASSASAACLRFLALSLEFVQVQ